MKESKVAVNDKSVRYQRLYNLLSEKKAAIEKDIRTHLVRQIGPDNANRIDSVLDQGDLSAIDMGEGVDLALLEMRNRMKRSVDQALLRLEEGSYGNCEDCGGEIEEKRLMAMLFAQLCIKCQRKKEELEKIEREDPLRDAEEA